MNSEIKTYHIRIPIDGLRGDALTITFHGTYDEMLLIRKALTTGSKVQVAVDKRVEVA